MGQFELVPACVVRMRLHIHVPVYLFDVKSPEVVQMVAVTQTENGGIEGYVVAYVQAVDHVAVPFKIQL